MASKSSGPFGDHDATSPSEDEVTQGTGEMECEFAEWFCVDHEAVRTDDSAPFSHRTGGDGRRVIIVVPSGPNSLIFPRTTRTESYEGHPHDAHGGRCDGQEGCKISHFGHVLVTVPVRVNSDSLDDSNYSCTEPGGQLLDFLVRRRRL